MAESYFNTTNVTAPLLTRYNERAESQEKAIKEIFKNKRNGGLTAVEVFREYPEKGVLLTSIRRSLTNLKNQNYLEKTSHKREGMFGRGNFVYRLNTGQMTLF